MQEANEMNIGIYILCDLPIVEALEPSEELDGPQSEGAKGSTAEETRPVRSTSPLLFCVCSFDRLRHILRAISPLALFPPMSMQSLARKEKHTTVIVK